MVDSKVFQAAVAGCCTIWDYTVTHCPTVSTAFPAPKCSVNRRK